MLVAEGAEHGEAGVEGGGEGAVGGPGLDEVADVGHGGDVLEEAGVRAGHVAAHVEDEVVRRCWWCGGFGSGSKRVFGFVRGALRTGGAVLDAEDEIEELDDGALCVATAGVLDIFLGLSSAIVEDNAVGKASISHVLATREEGANAVIEDVWIAVVVHPLEEGAQLVKPFGEGTKAFCYCNSIVPSSSVDG